MENPHESKRWADEEHVRIVMPREVEVVSDDMCHKRGEAQERQGQTCLSGPRGVPSGPQDPRSADNAAHCRRRR